MAQAKGTTIETHVEVLELREALMLKIYLLKPWKEV